MNDEKFIEHECPVCGHLFICPSVLRGATALAFCFGPNISPVHDTYINPQDRYNRYTKQLGKDKIHQPIEMIVRIKESYGDC